MENGEIPTRGYLPNRIGLIWEVMPTGEVMFHVHEEVGAKPDRTDYRDILVFTLPPEAVDGFMAMIEASIKQRRKFRQAMALAV